MARSHSLVVWTVVFAVFAAANLRAAEERPKKLPAEKPQSPAVGKAAKDTDPSAGPAKQPGKLMKHRPSVAKEKPAKPMATKSHKGAFQAVPLSERVPAIEKALASPIHLDFTEAPLQDVIDFLKTTHDIEILIDKKVLEDKTVRASMPVTINVKGIRLESALRLMLRNMRPELTFIIKDRVLLITTLDVANEELATVLYPVPDLVACHDEHDTPWDDYETLIKVITSTIKPTTWDDVGAPGSIVGNTIGTAKILVVSQTREVHEEIADLLAKIREIAKDNPNAGVPRRNRPAAKAVSGQMGPTSVSVPETSPAQPKAAPKNPPAVDKPSEKKPPTPSGQSKDPF